MNSFEECKVDMSCGMWLVIQAGIFLGVIVVYLKESGDFVCNAGRVSMYVCFRFLVTI